MPFLDPASNPACFINDFCGPDRRLKDAMRPPNCSFIEVAAGENSGSATDSFVFVMALRTRFNLLSSFAPSTSTSKRCVGRLSRIFLAA